MVHNAAGISSNAFGAIRAASLSRDEADRGAPVAKVHLVRAFVLGAAVRDICTKLVVGRAVRQ
ncbi:MAG: hypothetical protein AAGB10_17020 [Pseudomonadota bacterium]